MPPSKKQSKMYWKDKILSKFTIGRTKSMKKRKRTLLLEYKLMNKSNKFVDRRIGEKDRNMTSEDRIIARFVAQRVKSQNKKQMFNLNNDEVLTHQERTLQDVEKFDNPRSDSEDEDGKLEASFVERAHFGGGLFTRNTNNESTRQNTIDQLIAESKRRKAERQQTKEETQTLTDKLDNDLKELFPVFNNCKVDEPLENVKMVRTRESYDILVRELKFERIGKPSNKIKSDEEIAAEEKEKLKILERERLERMKRKQLVTVEDESKPESKKHISADDLDDDFDLDESDGDNDYEEQEESGDEYSIHEKENVDDSKNVMHNNMRNEKNSKSAIVPVTFTDLVQELEGKSSQEKITHIKDLMKIQKIHTGVSVKENFIKFFEVLLEYVDSLFTQIIVCEDSYAFASQLSPVLFDLLKIGGDEVTKIVFSMLKKKQQSFVNNKKVDVTLDTLIFLKFIPLLFPTSDYLHPIATPAMAFICHVLWKNSCKTVASIAKGLFLCTIMLECVHLSGRYCPEAIIFLRNVIYTAITDFDDPHPPVHTENKILVLNTENLQMNELSESQLRLNCSLITPDSKAGDDDMVKLSLIYSTLRILIAYSNIYSTFSANNAIWSPVASLLSRLKCCQYPEIVKSEIVKLEEKIKFICECPVQYLMAEKKRPKALRLYEPNIRPVINGRSFRTVSQDKQEKEKLLHQYKREMKSALREIRKDKNFLARVKLNELAKKDMERKEKVKRIFGWGQTQQSELKQMERKNRYRRLVEMEPYSRCSVNLR